MQPVSGLPYNIHYSRSIPPEDVRTLGDVLSPLTSASHATTEGPVEGQVSEGQSQGLAELVEAVDLPGEVVHQEQAYFRPKWGYSEVPVCQPSTGSPRRQFQGRPCRDPKPRGGDVR